MNGPQAKQPLVRVLTGPYGHPYHPILVTLPIGAWVASLIFDVASHLVSGPAFLAQGAVWLIALGVVGALLAASVGFLDFLTIPRGTPAFRTGLLHLSLNLAITVAFALNFLWRLGGYGHAASTGAGMIALSAVSLAALTVSGYLGGKLAYRYGVRVADEATQEEGYRAASRRPSVAG
jgi:uncharacterized membrane protein